MYRQTTEWKWKKAKRMTSAWALLVKWKKTMQHDSDCYTNCNWCSWYSHQKIGKKIRRLENKRASGDHPNYTIVENSQNTERIPRDLSRLVTQIPVKDHQLKLIWKNKTLNKVRIENESNKKNSDHDGICGFWFKKKIPSTNEWLSKWIDA